MKGLAAIGRVVLLVSVACPASAQSAGTVYGGYDQTPLTLSNGQTAPLQLDRNGNLEVDCIVGCGGGGATAGGTVSQGTAAAPAGAWPVAISLGGAAVGSGNALPVLDLAKGTPVSSAAMPTGGSGTLGWLSAIDLALTSGTITVVPSSGTTFSVSPSSGATFAVSPASGTTFPVADANDGVASSSAQLSNNGTGILGWLSTLAVRLSNTLYVQPVTAGTVSDTSVTVGTTSTSAVPAAPTFRYRATLTNTSTVSGNTVWCRADGGTAAIGTGIPLPPNGGGYEWVFPLTGKNPAPAIACIASSASASIAEEYVQ